jgi:hypothetical protein
MYDGDFEGDVTIDARTNEDAVLVVASADEFKRNAESRTEPDKRFHYRYQAAVLAWEAAKLMPNNSDDTARLLCTAGSWLKRRDPIAADMFYKALVRRCRKTAIGARADTLRWFPELDEDGNLLKPEIVQPETPPESEVVPVDEEQTMPPEVGPPSLPESADQMTPIGTAREYIVQKGDSAATIAKQFGVTIRAITEANAVSMLRLKVGQRLVIPEMAE